MVGGPEAAFERVKPLFELMGKNITLVGGNGDGQTTKVANQIIVALNIAAVGEALVFASKAGADPAKVRQALMGGFASSRILEVHGERMIKRTFNPGFRIGLHQKDLSLALAGRARARRGAAADRRRGAADAGLRRQRHAGPGPFGAGAALELMAEPRGAPKASTMTEDRIAWVRVSSCVLPLATPISDAKVLTGRQKPMTEMAMLFAEVQTADGHEGLGFSYAKRAGGPGQFAHAKEVAPVLIGEDPSDIGRLWNKLCWAGASVGRSGLATQAHRRLRCGAVRPEGAARRSVAGQAAGQLRAIRCACYNTSGGFLHTPLEQLLVNAAASRERGIGGIKLKVGQPDRALDIRRVEAVRKHLGDDMPLMVDANQQWDRPTAQRMCRVFEDFNLVWIEEPLDAYDHEGHAALAAAFDTPIATGEMLTSAAEHADLIRHRAADFLMPDAPRVGGITPFLKIAAQAEARRADAGAALRDGAARAPGRGLPERALGRALRLAGAAVQRTAGNPRRPHARAHAARPGPQLERTGPRLDAWPAAEAGARP